MPWGRPREPLEPEGVPSCASPAYLPCIFPPREQERTRTPTLRGFATALYVWVDGTFVGYREDGGHRRASLISRHTDALARPRDCRRLLRVPAFAAEGQDSWRFHGIFRSVSLVVLPRRHVAHLRNQRRPPTRNRRNTLDVADVVDLKGGAKADASRAPSFTD